MRFLWTMLKVAMVLAIAIPLCILAFAVTAGIVGTLFALAIMALRVVFVAALAYVGFRVVRRLFGGSRKAPPPEVHQLPSVDPYYQAALRELDAEMGHAPSR
jgi:hypothetical protein